MYRVNKKTVLYNNNYINAMSIYPAPPNTKTALFKITKHITGQRLSKHTDNRHTCDVIIMNPNCLCEILEYKDLDILIKYLYENQMTVDYHLSKLLKKDSQELIFYIN